MEIRPGLAVLAPSEASPSRPPHFAAGCSGHPVQLPVPKGLV